MAQTTTNTTAFIDAQVYSQFLLENLKDGLLPDGFFRDVSDFPSGTTLNIKTIGAATLQDVTEDRDITFSAIDTNTVTLAIDEYVGDAFYITDVLRQDGAMVAQLESMRMQESLRAIQERFETDFLATANAAQTSADANTINGQPTRFAGSGGSGVFDIDDVVQAKLSMDKANVPQMGRIGIVDPIVEARLNSQAGAIASVDRNPQFQSVLEQGFAMNHKFVMNLYGFDIWTSNRLPTGDGETLNDKDGNSINFGTSSNDVSNIFMSILDDNTKPIMGAWRQLPKTEADRNVHKQRDEFFATARWGFGAQRVDSLVVIVSANDSF